MLNKGLLRKKVLLNLLLVGALLGLLLRSLRVYFVRINVHFIVRVFENSLEPLFALLFRHSAHETFLLALRKVLVNQRLHLSVLVLGFKGCSQGIQGSPRSEEKTQVGWHLLLGNEAFHSTVLELYKDGLVNTYVQTFI